MNHKLNSLQGSDDPTPRCITYMRWMEMNRSNRSSTVQGTHPGPSRSIHAFVLLVQFPPGSLVSLRPSCSVASFSDFLALRVTSSASQYNSAWEDIFYFSTLSLLWCCTMNQWLLQSLVQTRVHVYDREMGTACMHTVHTVSVTKQNIHACD